MTETNKPTFKESERPTRCYGFLMAIGPLAGMPFLIIALCVNPLYTTCRISLLFTAITVVVLGVIRGLSRLTKISRDSQSRLVGPALTLATTVVIFSSCELFFTFQSRCHGVNYTLAGTLWRHRYVHYNALGYRDDEINVDREKGKRKVFVVGDSLTMGHGIDDPELRFSNVLRSKLPENYFVANLGMGGSDTPSQLLRLKSYPMKPDIIVLQYFGNDIGETASAMGFALPGFFPYHGIPESIRLVIRHSYLLDWVYWSFPQADHILWWDHFLNLYKNEKVLTAHRLDLAKFADYAQELHVPLVIVFFPFLHELEKSTDMRKFVLEFCRSRNIPLIDVYTLVEATKLSDRIVNVNDVHPSSKVHRIVGEALHRLLENSQIL